MGYFVKCGNLYCGPRYTLVNTKEKALYKNHPSECRQMVRVWLSKGLDGPFDIIKWTSDETIERINHGS